jgi:hypothetical protein
LGLEPDEEGNDSILRPIDNEKGVREGERENRELNTELNNMELTVTLKRAISMK